MKRLNKKKIGLIFTILFFAVIAFIFVFLFSRSTSPLYSTNYGGDSAQFQTIGHEWLSNGMVPYRDIFDHKGPILFFLNGFGKTWLVIFQTLTLTASLLGVMKIASLASDKRIFQFFCAFAFLLFLSLGYSEGNMSEEYCLPFVLWSTYFQVRYLLNLKKPSPHEPKYAFLYGITIGVCLMTQITNCLPVAVGILIIMIYLSRNKLYKNLKQNILMGLAGIAVICLPFVLYFTVNGALGDLIFGILGYNISYALNMPSWIFNASRHDFINFVMWYSPVFCIFAVAIFAIARKKYQYGTYCIVAGTIELVLYAFGALYPQYGMIVTGQAILFVNELTLMDIKDRGYRFIYTGAVVIFMLFLYNQTIICTRIISDTYSSVHAIGDHRPYDRLVAQIPEEERDSFVAYGGNELKDLYLRSGLHPKYKYFVIQEWHAQFNDGVKQEIKDIFSTGDAQWIITDGINNNISDTLDEKYELIDTENNLQLFRKKSA